MNDSYTDDYGPAPYDLLDPGADKVDIQPTGLAPHRPAAMSSNDYSSFVSTAVDLPPRDLASVLAEAKRVGSLLGEDAVYSYPAGGSRIEGPTIKLAYALAQVWGRCVTRVALVDQIGNRAHLRGIFVDLQTLAITERDHVAHIAPPPGKFANKPDQVERWNTMQLQNASSKAVRGAILGGIPGWLVNAAVDAAKVVTNKSALRGKTLPEALNEAATAFQERHGLTRDELAAHLGTPWDLFALADLVELRKLMGALNSGDTTVAAIRAALKPAEEAPAKKGLRSTTKPKPVTKPEPEAKTSSSLDADEIRQIEESERADAAGSDAADLFGQDDGGLP